MRYENRAFKGETLTLDGNEYINCTFEDCVVVYAASGKGGEITPLSATGFTLRYEGAAAEAFQLHQRIIAIGSAKTPVGSALRIGEAWFQRIKPPVNAPEFAPGDSGMSVHILG